MSFEHGVEELACAVGLCGDGFDVAQVSGCLGDRRRYVGQGGVLVARDDVARPERGDLLRRGEPAVETAVGGFGEVEANPL
jgi:hypothetical protein